MRIYGKRVVASLCNVLSVHAKAINTTVFGQTGLAEISIQEMTQPRRSKRLAASTLEGASKRHKEQRDEPAGGNEVETDNDKMPLAAEKHSTISLEVGDKIPDVSLRNQDGEEVSLAQVAKKGKIIVIFVYPRASTPGCTRQACGFRDNFDTLTKNAIIFGLSADSVAAQLKFKTKQHLPYDLLSDPNRHLLSMLGASKTAPQKGTIRSHFIFVDGVLKVKHIKISPEASISTAKDEVAQMVTDQTKS